jgi:hypothetical protein
MVQIAATDFKKLTFLQHPQTLASQLHIFQIQVPELKSIFWLQQTRNLPK